METSALTSANTYLDQIRQELEGMLSAREGYTNAVDEGNQDLADDYVTKFDGHKENIRHLIDGGTVQQGWFPGYESDGDWVEGGWSSDYRSTGLKPAVGQYTKQLEDFISNMTFRDDSLKELVDLCNDAQEKKAHLQSLVDNLEAKLERGECSPDLKAGLMEEEDESGKTLLEHYRDLLQYDVAAMGQAMQQYDEPQIQQVIFVCFSQNVKDAYDKALAQTE